MASAAKRVDTKAPAAPAMRPGGPKRKMMDLISHCEVRICRSTLSILSALWGVKGKLASVPLWYSSW